MTQQVQITEYDGGSSTSRMVTITELNAILKADEEAQKEAAKEAKKEEAHPHATAHKDVPTKVK